MVTASPTTAVTAIAQLECKCRQDVLLAFEPIAYRGGKGGICGFG
ncbi:MAG: hypothetical protein ACAH24_12530 [Hyphomicrobiaceae bacterium]|jgi:hypothetical protein